MQFIARPARRRLCLAALVTGLLGATLIPATASASDPTPLLDGTYRIHTGQSGWDKVVDVSGSLTANGAPVIQYTPKGGANQRWYLNHVMSGYGYPSVFFTLRPAHAPDKCLDIDSRYGQYARAQLWQCNGGYNQQFAASPAGWFDGQAVNPMTRMLRVRHSSLFLDVVGSTGENGLQLMQNAMNFSNMDELFTFHRL